jgi:hypothetical protein
MVAACVDYLQHHYAGRATRPSADAAIRSALAAARVQAWTAAVSPGTARRVNELAATLVQQQATIDRLLAHIPGRMRELDAARLEQIRALVAAWAAEVFELPAKAGVEVRPERESDTEACHRVAVRIPLTADADPEVFVRRERVLHERLAQTLGKEEFRAVQLTVEPTPSP